MVVPQSALILPAIDLLFAVLWREGLLHLAKNQCLEPDATLNGSYVCCLFFLGGVPYTPLKML